MRFVFSATLAMILFLVPSVNASGKRMELPTLTVGNNLEAVAKITLDAPALGDLPVVVKSTNPRLLLLAENGNDTGNESITITVPSGSNVSPEFVVQGLGDKGKATFEARATGFGVAKGTAILAPSGVVMKGIMGLGKPVATFVGANPQKFTIVTAVLTASGEYVQPQAVAGGRTMSITLNSSNPAAGTVSPSNVSINGGESSRITHFTANEIGETEITASLPPEFRPSQYSTVKATVGLPGILLSDLQYIGHDLQITGTLGLGRYAPEGGVAVTLTSNDPSRLLISTSPTQPGAKAITIQIAGGEVRGEYYLQALGDQGTETYTASAPGFKSRTATVTLGPSGILMGMIGAPDENEFFNKESGDRQHGFGVSLSHGTTSVHLFTAFLHPTNHRGADITVQPLRPGVSVKIELESSNPAVATVDSLVTITSPSEVANATVKLLSKGTTVLSVKTPQGFTTAANATSLKALVTP